MLSNNGLCLRSMRSYMLLFFLVLAVNSNWFEFYIVTHSYSRCPFLYINIIIINMVNTRAETNILVIRIFAPKCSIRICFQQPADSFAHTQ